ncbi:MAG TPA: DCC1-like thiol-disulfide oxidoreductase family protein [Bacteroidia bacterium]
MSRDIVFFDGVCNLCNASVQWVIRHDPEARFQFAPLQGSTAKSIITEDQLKSVDSIVYFDGLKYYVKSSAALKILSKLGFPYNLSKMFFIVPGFIRNAIYDIVARNRYKWFGKQDSCMMPTPELKRRFLE